MWMAGTKAGHDDFGLGRVHACVARGLTSPHAPGLRPRRNGITHGTHPRAGTWMGLAAVQSGAEAHRKARQNLVLGTLGIVYGDIGTSPLYTMKQCLASAGGVSEASVLGVLSLIAWALTTVVTFKYVIVIMRADNRGAGGTLALTALALRSTSRRGRRHKLILAAGLVGASLFFGDGVITPAISVLSAVEGLKIATPLFEPYVVPLTVVILIGLFAVASRGTRQVCD